MKLLNKIKKNKKKDVLKIVEKKHIIRKYIYLIIATLIYAISYNLFFYKNNIVYGGVSGISIIFKNYVDPTFLIFILNIFVLILSLIFLGKKSTLKSVLGSILFPLFIKLTYNITDYIKLDNDNLLLITIFGGVCVGIASGIVFRSGFTTGGTDIINQIVSKYFKVSVGTSMILVDGLIAFLSGFFFGWTRVLYALIVIYIINIMVDKVMLGISSSKAIYITTDKDEDVWNYLLNELKLGVTLIETRGGFTYKKDEMIMCVVSTIDYFKVTDGVKQIDKNAVILVTDAYQTYKTYGKREVN